MTWLADSGLRIGELTGLHLVDLHLRAGAGCGECPNAHLHVCHRCDNRNRAAAKTKPDWWVRDGVVTGGLVKRASPAMVNSYFEYMTSAVNAGPSSALTNEYASGSITAKEASTVGAVAATCSAVAPPHENPTR